MNLPLKISKTILLFLLGFLLVISLFIINFYFDNKLKEHHIEDILKSVDISDLIAMVFWDKDNSETLVDQIMDEIKNDLRDQVTDIITKVALSDRHNMAFQHPHTIH